MILWKSKSKGSVEGGSIIDRRWALELLLLGAYKGLGLKHQVNFTNRGWADAGQYYVANFTKKFHLGYEDLGWYDGQHECFSLGFLHFVWSR